MNGSNDFSMDVSSIHRWRTLIKIAAYLVYLAGLIFATITFSQNVADHFPEDQIMRAMAFAGAWANLGSMAIMPLAKEYWISGPRMSGWAWVFWIAEFLVIILNTLAAYGSNWAAWWVPLSPASPVLVVAVWGLLWYLNPEAQAHQDQVNFYLEAQSDFQAKLRRAMKSQRVQEIMADGAAQAAQQYAEKSLGVVIDPTYNKKAPGIRPAIEAAKLEAGNGRVKEPVNPKNLG